MNATLRRRRAPASLRVLPPAARHAGLPTLPADEVFARFGSRAAGLTTEEAAARLAEVGPNELEETGGTTLLHGFVANVTNLMAILLWVAGVLALLAELPQLAIAVWVVNLINGIFSTWQEHRAEQAVQALRRLLPATARVLRDGVEDTVEAATLVPGDVLLLAEGDRISVDARLVAAHELRVDQSALTGESDPVRRTAEPQPPGERPPAEELNRVVAGTLVTSGRGTGVVVATGMDTAFGAIATLTQSTEAETSPLQRELATLTRVVAVIAVTLGVAFLALSLALTDMSLSRGLIFSLGMIVAFVPEGLLPTVTLSLAMATQRMARRQALVKRLSAVETLGSTTVICTDKTGTLTANQMTMRAVVTPAERIEVTGTGYEVAGAFQRGGRALDEVPASVLEVLRTGALANDARLDRGENGRVRLVGDPTEAALLVAAAKAGIDVEVVAGRAPRVAEFPFDTARKRMSTVHLEGAGPRLHVKGAARELLTCCSRLRTVDGDRALEDTDRAAILAAHDELSGQAMRVLGVATRDLDLAVAVTDLAVADAERDLVWLGLVGLLDPPRPAVAEAVRRCRGAGIRILMITGDYGITAESIARRVGIVAPDEQVRIVNGAELDDLDDTAVDALLADPVLFARATPEHKLRVVAALQARGEVVAVTGDGVNDAPALKRADIGVAMGASGTDVAREAADIVLLDDDFASIVAAVEEGRAVYDNVRRFTGYIFTSNTPEAVPFVLFGLSGGVIPIALGVTHILTVDLGTDLAPALALGAERPEPGVMDRPPRSRDEHLVTAEVLRRSYLWLGPIQAACTMGAFLLAYRAMGETGGWSELPDSGPVYAAATAAALAAVVSTQIGNLLAHRTERASIMTVGWGSNPLIWAGVAFELALIAAIVYLPPFQALIGTAVFPAWLWVPLLGLAPTLLLVDEARKALLRHHERTRSEEVRP